MTSSEWITVGKITAVFGIKGWVKVHSYTQPAENLFNFEVLRLSSSVTGVQALKFDAFQVHGKGYIAHIIDCDDRNDAMQYIKQDIQVDQAELPDLEYGEFYWHQLEGMDVWTEREHADDAAVCLGKVSHLLETGANDVLVVQPSEYSIDKRERLIPYIDQVVKQVSMEKRRIELHWDIEF